MKKSFRILIIIAIVVLLIVVRFVTDIGIDKAPDDRFIVNRIIDGDTFELTGGDRLRLIGIDCPEKGEPYYDSATSFSENMALGKLLKVKFGKRKRDGYGRMLGYAYIDSVFLNAEIIRNGLAYIYLFSDNLDDEVSLRQLLKAQNEAMDNNSGIWSIKRSPEPYYLVKKGSLRFHRDNCRAVKNAAPDGFIRFDTRIDAFKEGYSPCRNCKP